MILDSIKQCFYIVHGWKPERTVNSLFVWSKDTLESSPIFEFIKVKKKFEVKLNICIYWTSDSDRFYTITLVRPFLFIYWFDFRNCSKDFAKLDMKLEENLGKNIAEPFFEKKIIMPEFGQKYVTFVVEITA